MKKSIWVWAMVALISLIGLIIMNAEARAANPIYRTAYYVPYQDNDVMIKEVQWIGSWGTRITIKDGKKTKTDRVTSYYGKYYQAHQYGQAMADWKKYYRLKISTTETSLNAMKAAWKTYHGGKAWGE